MMGPDYPLSPWAEPVNGYEQALPSLQIQKVLRDVTYWMMQLLYDVKDFRVMGPGEKSSTAVASKTSPADESHRYSGFAVVNGAIAGSELGERLLVQKQGFATDYVQERLKSHDEFLRSNIRKNDVLVVSLGGNDLLQGRRLFAEVFNAEGAEAKKSSEELYLELIDRLFEQEKWEYLHLLCPDKQNAPRLILLPSYFHPESSLKLSAFLFGLSQKLGMGSGNAFLETTLSRIHLAHQRLAARLQKEWPETKVVPIAVHELFGLVGSAPDVTHIHPTSQGALKLAYGYLQTMKEHL
ncbi:unnamed protein product [Amoebophrya sp. A120]|nr:unnamed protein product [Amoebophrya sp. A120]|eukprot:GSA120T00020816001.1